MIRQENWLTVPQENTKVKEYIGDYDKAFVRILQENSKSNLTFTQYFQVSYMLGEKKQFKSFKIYNDSEETDIKQGIPNIPTHIKVV